MLTSPSNAKLANQLQSQAALGHLAPVEEFLKECRDNVNAELRSLSGEELTRAQGEAAAIDALLALLSKKLVDAGR